MKKNYLVTGASGFVGSHIVRKLVEQGESVNILVRNKNTLSRLSDIIDKLSIYESNLQDLNLKKVIATINPSVVFHLAAQGTLPGQTIDPEMFFQNNVLGLVNLIHALKECDLEVFVNTGSSSEYGVKDTPMKETDTLEPINDYGVSKAAATLYAQKIAKTEDFPLVTLRLFSPYGYLDDPKRLITYVILQALQNKPISLSSQHHVRDFIFINDVVDAYMRVVKASVRSGEILNIGSGKQESVYDIVKEIIELTGSTSDVQWDTMPKQTRQIEPKMWQADITKAKQLLDWSPKYSLREGLKQTIALYQAKGYE